MNRRIGYFVSRFAALMIALVLIACTFSPDGKTKTFFQMTPVEKTTYAMSIYNRQYSDYMDQMGYAKNDNGAWRVVSTPVLSDEQKEVLKVKKKILTDLHLAISIYKMEMQLAGTPSEKAEQQLYNLLNKIGG